MRHTNHLPHAVHHPPQCLVRFQEMAYLMLCHHVAPQTSPPHRHLPGVLTLINLAQDRPITTSRIWRQLCLKNNPPDPVLGAIKANTHALLDEMAPDALEEVRRGRARSTETIVKKVLRTSTPVFPPRGRPAGC